MANTIRALERPDLRAVATLLADRLPGIHPSESFLADTLLDHPWVDPELPSLVAVDESGGVVGFLGLQVRRMCLMDRPLRAVCCSHLAVTADRRAGLAGALLLRKALSGPQDLSWTDSASEDVVRMWRALSGHLDHSRACDWMLVLRPARWGLAIAAASSRRRGRAQALAPVRAIPAAVAGPRLLGQTFPEASADVSHEDATPAAIIKHTPPMMRGVSLRVDHDVAHLDHVFEQLRATAGELVCRLVRERGTPIGWYAYSRQSDGASRVLSVSTAEAKAQAVLANLVESARRDGSTVLSGRAEPHLQGALRRHRAVLGYARHPLTHTRDPAILSLVPSSSSLLTHLDGEWFAL